MPCKTKEEKEQKSKEIRETYAIPYANLEIKIKELKGRETEVKNKIKNVCKLRLVGCFKFKKISNKQKKRLTTEICSICCDTHKINDLLTTRCKHHFGECCFSKYIEHKLENEMTLYCPLCRNDNILQVVKYY